MTTDYSQLLPEKNFTEPNTRRTAPYWIAFGLLALGASGYTAFNALGLAETSSEDAWLTSPLATPSADELQAASDAVFLDDSDPEPAIAEANSPSAPKAASKQPEAGDDGHLDAPSTEAITPDAESSPDSAPPAPGAVSATVGAYYLQVASYRTQERADEHARLLTERGLEAQSVAYGGPEAGWWHAVRMGPFKARFAAEKRRFDLQAHERRGAYVLPRSNGKYHVQVASFAEREEAEQVVKRFVAEGHHTKITRVRMSGSYWHCVRIGPFDNREEASAYQALVPDIPGSQSTVIPFGPPEPGSAKKSDEQ